MSRAIYYAGVHAAGDLVAKPTCPAGASPEIVVTPAVISDNGTGSTLSAIQAGANSISATHWRVSLRVRTETGWVTPSATYGRAAVFTKCS